MSKTVSFSHFVKYFYIDIEETKRGIWETHAFDRARFKNRIKEFESKVTTMNSLEDLLKEYIKPNKSTIVLGNLGRRPSTIIYYMKMLFWDLNVTIQSKWEKELETKCDVLIWLEPEFEQQIEKPSYAQCMIVFTSHLHFNYSGNVIGYHLGNPCTHYDRLIKKKSQTIADFKESIKKWNHYTVNDEYIISLNTSLKKSLILTPDVIQSTFIEIPRNSHVVVDLQNGRDSHEQYMCLLNSFEVLNYYEPHVINWFIYFDPALKKQFDMDMKQCIEKLKSVTFLTATTKHIDTLCKLHFLLEYKDDEDTTLSVDV